MGDLKKISDCWTVVYEEKDKEAKAYSYTLLEDAKQVKQMIEDNNGGELLDGKGNFAGTLDIEWCYLIEGKLIESVNEQNSTNQFCLKEQI